MFCGTFYGKTAVYPSKAEDSNPTACLRASPVALVQSLPFRVAATPCYDEAAQTPPATAAEEELAMKRISSTLVAAVLVLVVALPGCGCRQKVSQKIAEKAVEKAIQSGAKKDGKDVDVKMDLANGSMSLKSKDGSESMEMKSDDKSVTVKTQDGVFVSGDASKLPENFPKDVPTYPGAKLNAVSAMAQNNMFNVNMASPDPMDKVAAHFKKELAAQGWTEAQTMNQEGEHPVQFLNYTKGERGAMVTISRENDKTVVTVMTGNGMS